VAESYYRWETGRKPPGERYMEVLWPVEVWAVQVPPTGSGINVFQEAILGLMLSGVRDRHDLATQLALDKDLVAFILAQELQPRGWIDQYQKVTEKGRAALGGEANASQPLVVKYAFRDRIGGQWLPRLSNSLPDVMPVAGSRPDRPEFERDRNSGKTRQPFLLKGHQPSVRCVDMSELRAAVRAFQRDMRRTQNPQADGWDDLDDSLVDVLDDAPQLAYVWCHLYTSRRDIHPWLVSDPWGITPALKPLRLALEQQLPQEAALQIRMQDRLALDGPPCEQADQDLQAQIVLQAEARVQQWLSSLNTTPQHQQIRERVLRVLRLEAAIKEATQPRQEQLASLATESGTMLEALMQWVLGRWPAGAKNWPKDKGWTRAITETLLTELLLDYPLHQDQIKLLGGQSSWDVRTAALQQNKPFKALLVAGLLATQHHPDHPLRTIGLQGLDLSLLKLRNDGSHATGKNLQRDAVLALAESCLQWLGQFQPYFSR
jgi:hypothetical protein